MATVKVVLRKKKNKDGTYPIAIRITKDRKTSFIHLGYSIPETDWDDAAKQVKKSHSNSVRMNNYILKRYSEANDQSLELETSKPTVTAKSVKQKIKPKADSSFFSQADLYVQRLKDAGKFKRWTNERSNVKFLKEYLKSDCSFQDVTIGVLERYKAHLLAKPSVSERTATNHLVTVRSIFSMAIADGACDSKFYPFGKGKIKIKFPDSKKLGLTAAEVKRIESAELEGKANHARNIWLLSFYFAGIRVSDVFRLKWSDFHDGRLYYAMGKNNKVDSLKVSDKVMAILAQYQEDKDETPDLIFPELREVDLKNQFETDRVISSRLTAIDKQLRAVVAKEAKIKKPLHMHISRHTFGNISGDKIPIQMLQKLYRHSNISTTVGYQASFINKDTDDALVAVIGD